LLFVFFITFAPQFKPYIFLIMKKSFLTLLLMLSCAIGFAQTEQGNWLLGGNASLAGSSSGGRSVTEIQIEPHIGYFVAKQFALGLSLPISYSTSSSSSTSGTTFSIAPFGRYYFSQGKAKPFLTLQGGYISSSLGGSSATGSILGGGVGLAAFLTKSVALDLGLGYTSTTLTSTNYGNITETTNVLSLNIGFLVYLGGGNKE
jgi:hypothetical protein